MKFSILVLMASATGLLSPAHLFAAVPAHREISCDLLIVGGTESGWAAAIQAARMGCKSIVIVNDIDWLGGQYTAEAVCAIDENRGIGNRVPVPRSGLFKELTDRFENFNLAKYGHRQPGNAWTAHTTIRPAEAEAIFRQMLEPYIASGQVRLIENHRAFRAIMSDNDTKLAGLVFRPAESKSGSLSIHARITIDASDWGDAVKLSGAAYEFGVDYRKKYNEPNAPTDRDEYPVTDMNPITWCLVIEETDTDQLIEKPAHFDDRNFFLTTNVTRDDYLQLGWPHRPHRPFNPPWIPASKKFYAGEQTVYTQRRLVDSYDLPLKNGFRDVILLNWSIQDYPFDRLPQWVVDELEANEPGVSKKNVVEMTHAQRDIVFADAKRHSLAMLYHLQTTVHDRMEHKEHSFRKFRLSREFGTPDNLPPKPYIRESLRLKAMYMMKEQETRNFNGKDQYAPVMYDDGIAVWQFVYDFHPTGRRFLDPNSRENPWEIYIKPHRTWNTISDRALFPLRSLIPERVDGLIGAQKNLGYSSIVSSAVRLQDQCVHIGQVAGALGTIMLDFPKAKLQDFPASPHMIRWLRQQVCSSLDGGIPMAVWPFRDLKPEHPAYIAANILAVEGLLPLNRQEVDFRPDEVASDTWRAQIAERISYNKHLADLEPNPESTRTRSELVLFWWDHVKNSISHGRGSRRHADDFDGDGIPDSLDPLLYDPENRSLPDAPVVPAGPHEDGLVNDNLPSNAGFVKQFNFAGADTVETESFTLDSGLTFDEGRGYGWTVDQTENHRRRGRVPEVPRDTFLFTREHATWELSVPTGKYRVTVCVGDSGFEQTEQRVAIEDRLAVDDVTTAEGRFHEATQDVEVSDGRLTIQLGQAGRMRNTCVNWVRIVELK